MTDDFWAPLNERFERINRKEENKLLSDTVKWYIYIKLYLLSDYFKTSVTTNQKFLLQVFLFLILNRVFY